MPIVVGHDPNPTAIAAAGFAAGAGKSKYRQSSEWLKYTQAEEERRLRERLAQDKMRFEADREMFRAGKQMELQDRQLQSYADRQRMDQQGRMDAQQMDWQGRYELQARQVDAGIMEGIRLGKLELPPAAQKQLDQLNADEASMVQSGHYDDEAVAEFREKAQAIRRRILRTAKKKPQNNDLSLKEGWAQDTMLVDDGNGPYRVQRTDNGWEVIKGAPEGGGNASAIEQMENRGKIYKARSDYIKQQAYRYEPKDELGTPNQAEFDKVVAEANALFPDIYEEAPEEPEGTSGLTTNRGSYRDFFDRRRLAELDKVRAANKAISQPNGQKPSGAPAAGKQPITMKAISEATELTNEMLDNPTDDGAIYYHIVRSKTGKPVRAYVRWNAKDKKWDVIDSEDVPIPQTAVEEFEKGGYRMRGIMGYPTNQIRGF